MLPPEPRGGVRTAAWRAKAHAAAQWALLLHRPWDVDSHAPGRLSWRALEEYSAACRDGTYVAPGDDRRVGKFVGRGRYHWMTSLVTPIAPSVADRAVVMDRRASNRDLWATRPAAPNHDALFDRGLRPERRRARAGEDDGEGDEGGGGGGTSRGDEVSAQSRLVDELTATQGFVLGPLAQRANDR